jgi:hypothetical protein
VIKFWFGGLVPIFPPSVYPCNYKKLIVSVDMNLNSNTIGTFSIFY